MHLSNKAFTLSELLLACAILAFVLTSLLLLYITCDLLNESNRNLSIATSHGQYALEEVKSQSFGSIVSNYNTTWNSATISSKGLAPLKNESIVFQAQGSNIIDVIATVNWQDRTGRSRLSAFETYIAEQ